MNKILNTLNFLMLATMISIGLVSCNNDEAKPEEFFTLTIKTNPADAKVLINGNETKTYATKTKEAEEVEYEVSKEGYVTIKGTHNITQTETLNLVLSQELAAVKKAGKWGFVNKAGAEVIPFLYKLATPFANGLAAAQKQDGKWIFIDVEGKEKIQLMGDYDIVYPFYGEYAIVGKELVNTNKIMGLGMINKTGAEIIPCVNTILEPFVDGLAKCSVQNKGFGFYNESGNLIHKDAFANARAYPRGGICAVKKRFGSWLFFDKDAKQIGASFADVWSFTYADTDINEYKQTGDDNLLAAAAREMHFNTYFGYINAKGETAINFLYIDALPFSEGLAAVKRNDWLWGFVNTKGEPKIDYQFHNVEKCFSEGFAGVELKEKGWGFINKKGELVVAHQYDQVKLVVEGVSVVRKANNWGVVSTTGTEVISPKYTKVYNSSQQTILVKDGEGDDAKFFFFNHKGEKLFDGEFEDAWYFTAAEQELPYWTRQIYEHQL